MQLAILSYVFPIGIGWALFIKRRLPFIGMILIIYLMFVLCIEVTAVFLAKKGINNLWLYRVYLYGELIFPTLFFYNQFSKVWRRTLLLFVFISSIILTTLSNFVDDWQSHASLQTGITFGYIAFLIITYFVEMFQMEKVFNPFKDIYFVVGATLFLSQSCSLIYNVLYNHLASGYFGSDILPILYNVNLSLIVFYNILYSYALWISRLPRT